MRCFRDIIKRGECETGDSMPDRNSIIEKIKAQHAALDKVQ